MSREDKKRFEYEDEEPFLEEVDEMDEVGGEEEDLDTYFQMNSPQYMIESTMDLMRSYSILRELRAFFSKMDDWDRLVFYYAYELMQRNMQISYRILLYLHRTRAESFMEQIIYWGLLLFTLSNVQTAYSYLICRIYMVDKELARKIHEELKSQFQFFENADDMNGSYNIQPLHRLTRYSAHS